MIRKGHSPCRLGQVVGWESMIVLQDTRGLSATEAEDVCAWVARALLAAETFERPAQNGLSA